MLPLNPPLGSTLVAGGCCLLLLLLAQLGLARHTRRLEMLVDSPVILVDDGLVGVLNGNVLPHFHRSLPPEDCGIR